MGIMGRTPLAGVTWQILHYLEGFRRLGYDVYYIEDTGDWSYIPEQNRSTEDHHHPVNYIAKLMTWRGLQDRWGYRSCADGRTFGLSEYQVSRVFASADILINLTGATILRDVHMQVPVRIYLETDPVLPQIEVAIGHQSTVELLSAHTHHFTYGENIGSPDCDVPLSDFEYQPTRQPVVLDWWTYDACQPFQRSYKPPADSFSTISNWQQKGKDIEWKGNTYLWSKHVEFLKFIDLPGQTKHQFELALLCQDPKAISLLESNGWRVVDAIALSKDIFPYRNYIVDSYGEFTVAKDQYFRLRTGWFSDRSACYLAAGKPVVTQDTGFGNILPTGRGLFDFRTMEDILIALDLIASNYDAHRRAAREIAYEYFSAEKVLDKLIKQCGF